MASNQVETFTHKKIPKPTTKWDSEDEELCLVPKDIRRLLKDLDQLEIKQKEADAQDRNIRFMPRSRQEMKEAKKEDQSAKEVEDQSAKEVEDKSAKEVEDQSWEEKDKLTSRKLQRKKEKELKKTAVMEKKNKIKDLKEREFMNYLRESKVKADQKKLKEMEEEKTPEAMDTKLNTLKNKEQKENKQSKQKKKEEDDDCTNHKKKRDKLQLDLAEAKLAETYLTYKQYREKKWKKLLDPNNRDNIGSLRTVTEKTVETIVRENCRRKQQDRIKRNRDAKRMEYS